MLLVTGVLYAIWGELADAITIFVIIFTLNTVEVINEQRSKKAIASLRKLAEPTTWVRRNGHFYEIPVEQVVPGDLVLLQDGHRVPADARLIEAFGLSVDESALTGESLPVEKNTDLIQNPETPLAERFNMVYSSTLVSRGKGTAMVISTGIHTEIGRIAGIARQVKEPRTPLQNMMDELSKVLVWFALGFSLLVPLVGVFVAHQTASTNAAHRPLSGFCDHSRRTSDHHHDGIVTGRVPAIEKTCNCQTAEWRGVSGFGNDHRN